jgi:hypothetical protein
MQAQLDSELVQEALQVVTRLSPPMTGNVTLKADGGKLFLLSASDLSNCTIQIPGRVEGSALFAIPTQAFQAAIKGRKEVSLSYANTVLRIKAGRYVAELTTVDAILAEDEQAQGDDRQEWRVSSEQMQWLRQAVSAVSLKPTMNLTAYMPVSVILTKRAAFVACYDEQHMAFVSSKEITGDLNVTLPLETAVAVFDTFNKLPCRMVVTPSALFVSNKLIKVQLALPEPSDQQRDSTEVRAMAKEALTVDAHTIKLSKKDVATFMENARAIITKERPELEIATEQGKCVFSVKTTIGRTKTSVKAQAKNATRFVIDYEYFDEALRKCPDELVLRLAGEDFLAFRGKDARVLVSLNQEGDAKEEEETADE